MKKIIEIGDVLFVYGGARFIVSGFTGPLFHLDIYEENEEGEEVKTREATLSVDEVNLIRDALTGCF